VVRSLPRPPRERSLVKRGGAAVGAGLVRRHGVVGREAVVAVDDVLDERRQRCRRRQEDHEVLGVGCAGHGVEVLLECERVVAGDGVELQPQLAGDDDERVRLEMAARDQHPADALGVPEGRLDDGALDGRAAVECVPHERGDRVPGFSSAAPRRGSDFPMPLHARPPSLQPASGGGRQRADHGPRACSDRSPSRDARRVLR
jgi:hypothetical protein